MSTTVAAVLAVALLVLAVIAFFLVFRGRGNAEITGPFGTSVKMKGENLKPTGPAPGARIEDAQAEGCIKAEDRLGRGAEIKKARAGGDIIASSSGGEPPSPKA